VARVGISLLTLVPGIVGGSEVYARELCRALGRVGTHDYLVLAPTIAPDAGGPLETRVVTEYRASRTMPGRIAAMSAAALAPWPLRRAIGIGSLDALHFPLSVMLPPVSKPPAATTVLDIQHELLPQLFSRAELAYRRRVYGSTVRRSRLVLTISEHARETLIERLGLAPERVRAIHLAVDHERFRPDPGAAGAGAGPGAGAAAGAAREPFLLYPANRWAHKNHDRLFAALALVRRERPELRLVLTGSGHESHPAPDYVDVRGRVSADELLHLFRTASALVFPSLYEGFGMPVLEAMAVGCPVASSNAGSLPEVAGDAAVLFDPYDPEAIAAGILEALRRGDELAARGPARAAGFTWDACARAHDAVYTELLGSS
jgi:glycosyltransferase involved in cell wall biosynthesis